MQLWTPCCLLCDSFAHNDSSFLQYIGGLTDEQTGSFVDSVSAMDASTLKLILRALVFLGSLYKPATELYATVDGYTFGSARYLVLFIVMILAYYLSMAIWFVLKLVFVNLYFLFRLAQGAIAGAAPASQAAETVFQSAASSSVGGAVAAGGAAAGSLAAKVAAEGAAAAGVAAAVGGAAAGAASLGAGTPAVTESADDEF
jgi:hypothetical protein